MAARKLMKLFYLLDAGLIFLFLWLAFNVQLVVYGMDQAYGQLNIVLYTTEVEEILTDPSIPDSVKSKLLLVQEVKKFAIDSLGLEPTNNYTTYFDQGGKPLLWVLTASDRFALQPYEWQFPLLRVVSYKGY